MTTHIIALATTHALLENGATSGRNTRSVWCAREFLVATRSSSSTVTQTNVRAHVRFSGSQLDQVQRLNARMHRTLQKCLIVTVQYYSWKCCWRAH